MKRIASYVLLLILIVAVGGAFAYLYKKSKTNPTIFATETAHVADITKKTVATGSIVPRREVEVKPKVTGVLTELFVEAGKRVKVGDALGKISIIPDAMQTNQAQASLKTAQIAFANAKRELERNEKLFAQGVVADAELQTFRTQFALRKEELASAGSALQLVKEGATRGQGKTSTLIVTATADGTVIDVPVKVGFSVIQANNFNPGTTVAVIADMDDMIFDGHVDEAEVAKLEGKKRLAIKIGALEKEVLEGTLEYVAPKGTLIDGAIQFEIKASVVKKPGVELRANYSANADIVLDERKQVLAIREAVVQFDHGTPYVEIETAPQKFVRKDVTLGLSDGVEVEVLSGVTAADKLKVPENAGVGSDAPEKGPGHPPRRK
jgi:HlyD family secretion protein